MVFQDNTLPALHMDWCFYSHFVVKLTWVSNKTVTPGFASASIPKFFIVASKVLWMAHSPGRIFMSLNPVFVISGTNINLKIF